MIRMSNENTLKKHVEGKIFKGYMVISNLSEEEFKFIDGYCKNNFSDNRKRMILSLLKYNGGIALELLDDKLALIYEDLNARLLKLEFNDALETEELEEAAKKNTWKGFKK